MVHLQIDGKTIEVPEGTTVLRAADQNGIEIPRLCDHPALKPFGSCRVCLVEVQGMRTLQPSCTLPASENMVVKTSTPAVNEARKFVLGLLFSERNHFCPFCQQTGGDCELQNTALDHEMTHWPIAPSWKKFPVDASNPDILVDHNRCILCRRCVRACGDLVGMATLGFEERGSESMLMADLGSPLGASSCISCGVCVQVCPTGTLTDRHSAYQGRDRTGEYSDSVCIECGIGCGTCLFTRDNRVVRVDGDWQNDVNGGVLCKAGRFTLLDEKRDRVLQPMVRKGGSLVETTWEEALTAAAAGLKKSSVKTAAASSRLSAEALYAFQQLSLGLGAQASSLADRDVSQVPPFLGEHTGANLPKADGSLSKQPVTNASWAETFTVHAGANRRALQAMGLDTVSAKLDGSVLIALGDDQVTDRLSAALAGAGFVVAAASYQSNLTEHADVVLPVAIWAEQEGHFLNLTGHLQKTASVVSAAEGIKTPEAALVELAKHCAVEINGSWETALKVAA